MDVTSLLNSSAAARMEARRDSVDLTPTPSVVSNTTAASTGVVTPPPEKIPPSRSNSESRTPNRSRTPWDAGGYSLPLTLDTKLIRTPSTAKPTFYSESPVDHSMDSASPASPKHKFSDSRSSLSSSCTTASSSNNSGSHSRISSLSTVSEFQPLSTLITEFSSLEAKMPEEMGLNSNSGTDGTNGTIHMSSMGNARGDGSATGNGNDAASYRSGGGILNAGGMEALHMSMEMGIGMGMGMGMPMGPADDGNGGGIGELEDQNSLSPSPLLPESPVQSRPMGPNSSGSSPGRSSDRRSDRAQSPSDAVLITGTRPQMLEIGRHRTDPFGHILQTNLDSARGHKRAVSAPDFPGPRSRFQPSLGFSPILEPNHPSLLGRHGNSGRMSDRGENGQVASDEDEGTATLASNSSETNDSGTGSGTGSGLTRDREAMPLLHGPSITDEKPRCMYKDNCSTGSQLRKAISHLFGRNKMCTRLVPDPVWVHYCRKHYQRSRYRNGTQYSITQAALVITQIERIQKWSDENTARASTFGVVGSWSLNLRKREQNRVESKKKASNKRRRDEDAEGDSDADGDGDFSDQGGLGQSQVHHGHSHGHGPVQGQPDHATITGTAVPDWLRNQVRDGYNTQQMMDIMERLKRELEDHRITQIPDIEILPNISTDRGDDAKPRPKNPRRAPSTTVPPRGHKSSLSLGGSPLESMARRPGGLPYLPPKRIRGDEYDWRHPAVSRGLPSLIGQPSVATTLPLRQSGLLPQSMPPRSQPQQSFYPQPSSSQPMQAFNPRLGFMNTGISAPAPPPQFGVPVHPSMSTTDPYSQAGELQDDGYSYMPPSQQQPAQQTYSSKSTDYSDRYGQYQRQPYQSRFQQPQTQQQQQQQQPPPPQQPQQAQLAPYGTASFGSGHSTACSFGGYQSQHMPSSSTFSPDTNSSTGRVSQSSIPRGHLRHQSSPHIQRGMPHHQQQQQPGLTPRQDGGFFSPISHMGQGQLSVGEDRHSRRLSVPGTQSIGPGYGHLTADNRQPPQQQFSHAVGDRRMPDNSSSKYDFTSRR